MIDRLYGNLERIAKIDSFLTTRTTRRASMSLSGNGAIMTSHANIKRRPSVHITLQRASRLHRLVGFLATGPRTRPAILCELRVGLRTFYRELELLKKCGVKVRHKLKLYHLLPTAAEAEGRLPFPDPQLSFAEMAELAH